MNILPICNYSNYNTPSFGISAKTGVKAVNRDRKDVTESVTASTDGKKPDPAIAAAVAGQVLVNKDSTIKKTKPAVDIDVLKEEITSIQEKNLAVETKINQIDSYIEYRNNKVDSLVKELKSYYEFVKNENGEVDKFVDKIDKKSIQKIVDKYTDVYPKEVVFNVYVYDDLQYDLLRGALSKDAVDFIKTKGKEYNCLSFENYIKKLDVSPKNNEKSLPKNANAGTLSKMLDKEQQQLAKNEVLLKSKEEMLQTTKKECLEKLDNIRIGWIREYEEKASNKVYDVIRECRNYASNNIFSLFYEGVCSNIFGPYSDETKELVDLYKETNLATCENKVPELLDKSIFTFVSGYSEMNKALERYNSGERCDFSFEDWLRDCDAEFKVWKEQSDACHRRFEAELRTRKPEPYKPRYGLTDDLNYSEMLLSRIEDCGNFRYFSM